MYNSNFVRHFAKRIIMVLSLSTLYAQSTSAQSVNEEPTTARWAIALHGGAGSIPRDLGQDQIDAMKFSLERALAAGRDILAAGGSAVDAVEATVVALEDDSRFNAGKGAVFTRAGTHELDAAIMDGATLRCGAVGGVKRQKNPVKVARLVMERTPHVLLVGQGADDFARANGCDQVAQSYFYNERRFHDLQRTLTKAGIEPPEKPAYEVPEILAPSPSADSPHGTVGCVALDRHGNLAAATSTGGLTGKLPGRIGDTPINSAGNYATSTVAVSCTGKGEQYIRHAIAARVAWLIDDRQLTVDRAVEECLGKILDPGDGGIIAVDRQGNISMRSTTGSMPRATADSTGRVETAIWFDP
jgi:beta-aspartyl-peptidase (threonine type)